MAGYKVVSSDGATVYGLIRETYGDSVAVEMEGAGFLLATHANAGVDALVIRGISDLVVDKKVTDEAGWQDVAARNAAAFAVEFLVQYRPETNNGGRFAEPQENGQGHAQSQQRAVLAGPIEWRPPLSNETRPGYSRLYHAVFTLAGSTKQRGRAYIEVDNGVTTDSVRACISKGMSLEHEWRDLRPADPYLIPVFTRIDEATTFWLDEHAWSNSSTGPQPSPPILQPGTYVTGEPFLTRLHRAALPAGRYRLRVKVILGDTRNREIFCGDWRAVEEERASASSTRPSANDRNVRRELVGQFHAHDDGAIVVALRELRREVIHEILNVATPTQETRGDLEKWWIPKAQDWDARVERTMTAMNCDPADIEFVRDFPLPALRRQDFTYEMNSQWSISDTRREKLEAVLDTILGKPAFRR